MQGCVEDSNSNSKTVKLNFWQLQNLITKNKKNRKYRKIYSTVACTKLHLRMCQSSNSDSNTVKLRTFSAAYTSVEFSWLFGSFKLVVWKYSVLKQSFVIINSASDLPLVVVVSGMQL